MNTDRSGERGIHWVAVHFPLRGPAEYFDSLGNSPEYYNTRFRYISTINGPKYQYSTFLLESSQKRLACAGIIVFILLKKNKGFYMKNSVHDFSVSRLNKKMIDWSLTM